MKRYPLPWRFFLWRWITVIECVLILLLALFFAGAESKLILGLLPLASTMCMAGFVFVGSTCFVRWVQLSGSELRISLGRTERVIDLTTVRRVDIHSNDWFVPRVSLEFENNHWSASIPLIGETGRHILDHIITHVPEDVRPVVVGTLLGPYKPGFFRPREESLSLPEVR